MDRKKGAFGDGQAYMAFSRVRAIEGLHILNYDRSQVKVNKKVQDFMALKSESKIQTEPTPLTLSKEPGTWTLEYTEPSCSPCRCNGQYKADQC